MGTRDKFEHIWRKEQSPTERSVEDYLNDLHLREEDLEGKKILDVGAGLRGFARDAKEKGMKVDIFSVDPFYMLSREERKDVLDDDVSRGSIPAAIDTSVDDKTVAGLAEELPIKDVEFDYVFSNYSQPFYAEDAEELRKFIEEGLRVLKPGGQLRVAPYMPIESRASKARAFIGGLLKSKRLESKGSRLEIDVRGGCMIVSKDKEKN